VARHGALPAVRVTGADLTRAAVDGEPARPIVVVGLDATLIEADSNKAGAAGTYKGGYGFHPLTAWCTNVGDNLAVMLRPGNAGSFTASDHVLVLDAAIAQIPAAWRADVLVTVDGAGALPRRHQPPHRVEHPCHTWETRQAGRVLDRLAGR